MQYDVLNLTGAVQVVHPGRVDDAIVVHLQHSRNTLLTHTRTFEAKAWQQRVQANI